MHMRRAFEHPQEAREKGQQARKDVLRRYAFFSSPYLDVFLFSGVNLVKLWYKSLMVGSLVILWISTQAHEQNGCT